MSIPLATYRLQMNHLCTLQQVRDRVDYFRELGISHLYFSPLLQAKTHSPHGYDVVNHQQINPDLGTEADLEALVQQLRHNSMGTLLDIVPNHMLINDSANHWWNNVLENGPSSPYADYFDIDWNPPRAGLTNKVLLPLLEQQYGDALESQALKVVIERGAFYVALGGMHLPTDPCTWTVLLKALSEKIESPEEEGSALHLELASINTALSHLPTSIDLDLEKVKERQREKEIIKTRLHKVLQEHSSVAKALEEYLELLNGQVDDPTSFDGLERFVDAQPYRLCHWRVANDEINYRRFFDICSLAGIKTERMEVFAETHSKVFEWIGKGWIDGLRIDHIDGLIDPEGYLECLQAHCMQHRPPSEDHKLFYIIAEKILTGQEQLCPTWQLYGTVGYDFLNQLNGLFIQPSHKQALYSTYKQFTGQYTKINDLFYNCKKLILLASMSSEHHVLSRYLDRISEQHRSSRDFTDESLRSALRDVIASFPVYRSYIRADQEKVTIREEDRLYIQKALHKAKLRNPLISGSIFEFIHAILLLQNPPGLSAEQVAERRHFVLRFQQLTGPVTAKGIEDTACYRFFPLASLNEVGSDMQAFGVTPEAWHNYNSTRSREWPHSMVATSTHDTKRSEDVRARLNVLSEIPDAWEAALARWSSLNTTHKTQIDEDVFPDNNDEYLLYQALVGTWPLYPMDPSAHLKYLERIQAYMEKSIHEAKIYTSWINPNQQYDEAIRNFVRNTLHLDSFVNPFLQDLKDFCAPIQVAGMFNSLVQVALKCTAPGVPDIYQGQELWDFSLVDPDNRCPVDFGARQHLLQALQERPVTSTFIEQLVDSLEDGRLKLFITKQCLQLRHTYPQVFLEGSYEPLTIEGPRQDSCLAFARRSPSHTLIVIAGRFFSSLLSEAKPHLNEQIWQDTLLTLPTEYPQEYQNIFYNQKIQLPSPQIPVGPLLGYLPVAVLISQT